MMPRKRMSQDEFLRRGRPDDAVIVEREIVDEEGH